MEIDLKRSVERELEWLILFLTCRIPHRPLLAVEPRQAERYLSVSPARSPLFW
jgi:hypothetical protein